MEQSEEGLTSPDEQVILEARFDPRVKSYWFAIGILLLLATFVGIPLLLVWVLGLGRWYCRESFARLQCRLTSKSLVLRKGIFFRVERTIPLDKIQDLALRQGPLMRMYGIHTLRVETAGQSTPQGASEASLPGVVDPREFRDAVRRHRDARALGSAREGAAPARPAPLSEEGILLEIRDTLSRIEELLSRRG
ncbi:MAG: PH domain-containing protein [Planctomycetota bacterium]|jgi:putative membrane protein